MARFVTRFGADEHDSLADVAGSVHFAKRREPLGVDCSWALKVS